MATEQKLIESGFRSADDAEASRHASENSILRALHLLYWMAPCLYAVHVTISTPP